MKQTLIMGVLILCAVCFAAEPNEINDVNDLIEWARSIEQAQPAKKGPRPFNVIGVSNEWVKDVNDLSIGVLMLSEGKLYLLDNPLENFSKAHLPADRTVSRKNITQVIKAPKVWAELNPGISIIRASESDDPNSPWSGFVEGFTSWQMQAMDYMGTGSSFGIGIVGQFYSVTIAVKEHSGEIKKFYLEFAKADTNKDGRVDMLDYADYSAEWLKKAKLEATNATDGN